MFAREIMTSPVITVSPLTPVNDITALMRERHISGVPVLDADQLVGIVSESDLLHRYEAEADRCAPRPWWSRLIQRSAPPLRYVRSHGTRAADIMTCGTVSVTEDTPLAQIALLLTTRQLRRVPVLRGKRLVGIVTSADLVAALLAHSEKQPDCPHCDEEIQARLTAELDQQEWWNPHWSHLSVIDGIVSFHGMIEHEAQRDAARVAAENTPGVRGVVDDRIRAADWQAMA
ncbi:putative manganese-dependent inorganic pyrophosphatase [Variovorax sp. SRS16]|uniref:CBS domain-containing protein n=1 Tax=Variovorax sp. SRS16 TaxID=282217 RepID=UPI0013167112|nr:CBS domain-containing protein [Variovorax sp. SRS16]VTU15403.1 putative manganese-dependent inorganic pyrophosphatase [Variovorax sp. SRS16]